MSKEIVLAGWVSIVPDKMYKGWIKKKWIKNGAVHISCGNDGICGFKDQLTKSKKDGSYDERKLSHSKSETKRLEAQGFKKARTHFYITEQVYEKIREEVHTWYDMVFKYINEWLLKNMYISLKSGSFDGGFCAETNPDSEVVKKWGAPLAREDNKIVQIKEKFGEFRVYGSSMTDKEYNKMKKFGKALEKKFDCCAYFG